MPSYVLNYVAIHGDEQRLDAFRVRYFVPIDIPAEWNDKGIQSWYKLDVDAMFPMPEELRITGSPTEVFDTQEEADRANRAYLEFRMRGETTCIAITRNEALRRTFKYGRTARQQMWDDGSEYGIINGHDWAEANRTSTWKCLPVQILREEPGLLVFVAESPSFTPSAIYDRLIHLGFKVSWAWQGEEDSNYGMLGEYVLQWKRKIVWDFQPDEEWPTRQELRREAATRLKEVRLGEAERRQQREILKRREWAKWFREHPEDWKAFFPRHDMEAWVTKVEAEEGEV